MLAYYNEFDKKKCAALSQLMKDGYISKGEIDDRSIRDVRGDDLKGFERCHFFAGIGLWDYGLQLAGWPEDRPVWTGSCPCQPYSTAGKQKGKKDDRHLLPEWDRLIEECRPATIFGEQVANAITHGWLDDVYQRLEAKDYAIGSAVLPACSVGAPYRRERLWFVAHSNSINRGAVNGQKQQERDTFGECFSNGGTGSMVNSYDSNDRRNSREYEGEDGKVWLQERNKDWLSREPSEVSSTMADTENRDRRSGELIQETKTEWAPGDNEFRGDSERCSSLAYSECQRQGQRELGKSMYSKESAVREANRFEHDCSGNWENGRWIDCPDGKQRLIEPRIPLLAHGYPERVGIIHCAGDAIVPQVAAQFIKSFMEINQ
jgi:DNA (cytosine-5)-methyltransferase 1